MKEGTIQMGANACIEVENNGGDCASTCTPAQFASDEMDAFDPTPCDCIQRLCKGIMYLYLHRGARSEAPCGSALLNWSKMTMVQGDLAQKGKD